MRRAELIARLQRLLRAFPHHSKLLQGFFYTRLRLIPLRQSRIVRRAELIARLQRLLSALSHHSKLL